MVSRAWKNSPDFVKGESDNSEKRKKGRGKKYNRRTQRSAGTGRNVITLQTEPAKSNGRKKQVKTRKGRIKCRHGRRTDKNLTFF